MSLALLSLWKPPRLPLPFDVVAVQEDEDSVTEDDSSKREITLPLLGRNEHGGGERHGRSLTHKHKHAHLSRKMLHSI